MFGLESMIKSMLESSGINIEELISNGQAQVIHIMQTVDEINNRLTVIDMRLAAISGAVGATSMCEHLLAPIPDAIENDEETKDGTEE